MNWPKQHIRTDLTNLTMTGCWDDFTILYINKQYICIWILKQKKNTSGNLDNSDFLFSFSSFAVLMWIMKIGFRPFHKRLRVSQISRNSRNKREKKRTHQGLSINEVTNFSLIFLNPHPLFYTYLSSVLPPPLPPNFAPTPLYNKKWWCCLWMAPPYWMMFMEERMCNLQLSILIWLKKISFL